MNVLEGIGATAAVIGGSTLVVGLAGYSADLYRLAQAIPMSSFPLVEGGILGVVAALARQEIKMRDMQREKANAKALEKIEANVSAKADTTELREIRGRVTAMTDTYERDSEAFLETGRDVKVLRLQGEHDHHRLERVENDARSANEATVRIESHLSQLVSSLVKPPADDS